jgi:hypothetical protein
MAFRSKFIAGMHTSHTQIESGRQESGSLRHHSGLRLSLLLGAALLALNTYIAKDLLSVQFTRQHGSVESAFITYAAYAARNIGDLTWYPTWYGGTPFYDVYQPGLHLAVAALASLAPITPQHAYHLITGLAYAIGPVTLFCLCLGVTGRRGYAFAVGLFYSLLSPMALLSPVVARDVGSAFHPRRFQILVQYGEGPHIAAVMLLPLVLLFLYRAGVERKTLYVPFASVTLALLVLTNWPGTVGVSLAIIALCFAEFGKGRVAWMRLAVIGVIAYLLVCRWIPPSTVAQVLGNAQQSGGHYFHARSLLYLSVIAALLVVSNIGLERLGAPRFTRFAVLYTLLTGCVTLGYFWFGIAILPQPHRFQVELEMAIATTACALGGLLLRRAPRKIRITSCMLLLIAAVPLLASNRQYARELSAPMDMTQSSEYVMAKQFDRLRPYDRVFAPGSISLWMNLWTDTPQVSGCCDQSVPDLGHRHAEYVIYTGEAAGNRDAEISLLWLRAYGATAVGVDGPRSTEVYKPFRHPFKFDGVLPLLWRDGDDAIYDIPTPSRSLAHVIPVSAIIPRAPVNGIDIQPLHAYVAALEDATLPYARFRWTSRHSAEISTVMGANQVLSVQISYDPDWRATVNGRPAPILRDKLGQVLIDTGCHGPCAIELSYGALRKNIAAWGMQFIGLLLAIAIPFRWRCAGR